VGRNETKVLHLVRPKLARWAATLSPKLAAWREGRGAFPAAYAAGCIEIAAPQLWGDGAWRTVRGNRFTGVGMCGED